MLFSVVVFVIRRTDSPEQIASAGRLLPVGNVAVIVGGLGVIVFGVWLAISLDGVQVWDGWVIAAIVLWAIASEAGRRADPEFAPCVSGPPSSSRPARPGPTPAAALARPSRGMLFHLIATVGTILILIDMIWKPGA